MSSDFNIVLDHLALLKGQRALFRIRNGLLANIMDTFNEEDVKKGHPPAKNYYVQQSEKPHYYYDQNLINNNNNNMSSALLSEQQPLLSHDDSATEHTAWNGRNGSNSEVIEIFADGNHVTSNGLSRREKMNGEAHGHHYHSHHQLLSNSSEGLVSIPLPSPEREQPRYPPEKWKTLLAVLLFMFTGTVSTTCLAIIHDRVPDRAKNPPLPDIFFDLFPAVDWALDVSEIIIMVSIWSTLLFILMHKHRFIILRRTFLLMSLLYLMRSVTMAVTQMPVASTTYYCSPKENSTSFSVIFKRVLRLNSGFGLSIIGNHVYCGDYIFSGHTVTLAMCYLIIKEYTPRKWFLLHWLYWTSSVIGVVFVLLSRGHYTVDVVIAYYVTTRGFWIYHTMCNNPVLKNNVPNNFLARTWWFNIFTFFEKNVCGGVPREYEWPLPWPRRFLKRSRIS